MVLKTRTQLQVTLADNLAKCHQLLRLDAFASDCRRVSVTSVGWLEECVRACGRGTDRATI